MLSKKGPWIAAVAVLFCVVARQAIPAPQSYTNSDLCHVFAVDLEQNTKRRLGEFAAEVGEEQLTTRSYRLGNQYVTASVFYTDEMMASRDHADSMVVAIVVSPSKHENALLVENSVQSQVGCTPGNDKIQVKTRVRVDGRPLVVGLKCRSNIDVEPTEPRSPAVGSDPLDFVEEIVVDQLRPVEITCKTDGSLPFETLTVSYQSKEEFKREYPQILEDLDQRRDGKFPAGMESCTFAHAGVVSDRWPW